MNHSHHQKPIIISIAGDLGSGKSLLTGALVSHFGAQKYSTGNAQRQIAESLGISTLELNKRAETDKSIDDKIDSVFKDLAHSQTNLVVDSRMAFHFLPMSFRIRLEVHPKIAAARIAGDTGRIGEAKAQSIEDIEAGILARKASERARFKAYYAVDIEDHAGYDLVINTTGVSPEAVARLVIQSVEDWAASGSKKNAVWISPQQLYVPDGLVNQMDSQNGKSDDVIVVRRGDVCTSVIEAMVKHGADGSAIMTTGLCPLIVQDGVQQVSYALETGQDLVAVCIADGRADMPSGDALALWEKSNKFKYLELN